MSKLTSRANSGSALLWVIAGAALLVILAGVAAPKLTSFFNNVNEPAVSTEPVQNGSASREINPAISTLAACQAQCRSDYGGSGSPGFDACIRACGAGGALREAACGEPALACEVPTIPECVNGKWVCIGPAKGVD